MCQSRCERVHESSDNDASQEIQYAVTSAGARAPIRYRIASRFNDLSQSPP